MERKTLKKPARPKGRKVRPVDLRPGDLIRTEIGQATVLYSDLAQPGQGPNRNRRPEWWITYLTAYLDGRPLKQSQRFSPREMTEACIELLLRGPEEAGDKATAPEST